MAFTLPKRNFFRKKNSTRILALAAASKLMEQKVDDQTNRELVNAFLSEEGAGE